MWNLVKTDLAVSEKKTFEECDCIHVYSPGTIKINFHQISHGAFCRRDTVNLLKCSALLNKIGTMPLHGKNTVHYFFPRRKVLVLFFVALWFILRGDLLYVFPCVILFLCFSVLLVLRLPRLGKRELLLVLFVRLFGLCLFRFVGFLFLLGSGKGCGLWLWHSFDFSLTFFEAEFWYLAFETQVCSNQDPKMTFEVFTRSNFSPFCRVFFFFFFFFCFFFLLLLLFFFLFFFLFIL